MILGLLASLVLANAALACDNNPPPNCYCKSGQWYSNITNTVYNSTTNNTVNGVNGNVSAAAGSTSNATGGTATGGSVTGSGNSTQGQQQSLNNSGNNSSTSNSSIAKGAVTNTNTVAGGAGGQGGAGGAGGNATIAKGAVQNTNTNVNNVSGGTSTASIAAGAVQNTVGSSSTVGNVGSTSGATVGNVSTGASTSSASANGNGSGNGNGDTTVTYEGAKTYRSPVATAYSASLTSGADTCLGSISGGAQTQILGITLGGTKRDKGCDLIKQTHLLMELQQQRAACIRAQLKEEGALIKEAMKEAGAECPPLVTPVVEVLPPATPADAVTHAELRLIEDRITTKIVSK